MDLANAVRTRPRTSSLTSMIFISVPYIDVNLRPGSNSRQMLQESSPSICLSEQSQGPFGEEMGESLSYIHTIIFEQSFHLGPQTFLCHWVLGLKNDTHLEAGHQTLTFSLLDFDFQRGGGCAQPPDHITLVSLTLRFSGSLTGYLLILPLEIPCFTNHLHGALSVQFPRLHSNLPLITIIIPGSVRCVCPASRRPLGMSSLYHHYTSSFVKTLSYVAEISFLEFLLL